MAKQVTDYFLSQMFLNSSFGIGIGNAKIFLSQGETTYFWVVLAVAELLWLLLATIALFT